MMTNYRRKSKGGIVRRASTPVTAIAGGKESPPNRTPLKVVTRSPWLWPRSCPSSSATALSAFDRLGRAVNIAVISVVSTWPQLAFTKYYCTFIMFLSRFIIIYNLIYYKNKTNQLSTPNEQHNAPKK